MSLFKQANTLINTCTSTSYMISVIQHQDKIKILDHFEEF